MPAISEAPSVCIVGPTACGKSAVAFELAERLHGEIISVDSMQVYRGLDIGTAKPSAAELARIPHHIIDVADLTESFDAARFIELAKAAEAGIRQRGRLPIFCGGTGLYFNAWFNGLGGAPSGDPAIRAELEAAPLSGLLAELEAKDPATLAKLVVAQSELEGDNAASIRLDSIIRQQHAQLEGLPSQQLELSRLKLDLAVAEDTYRFVRKAYDEARIHEAEQTREIRVIAPGMVETYPVRPVKVYYAAVALALSLVVGIILALFFEYLNFTLETTSSAQEALQLPLLASFPYIDA